MLPLKIKKKEYHGMAGYFANRAHNRIVVRAPQGLMRIMKTASRTAVPDHPARLLQDLT